ncbi:hypothetical protein ACFLY0_00615 [Patescibacteria group bacterium]
MRRSLSRWCRPIVGSSSTYSAPTKREPFSIFAKVFSTKSAVLTITPRACAGTDIKLTPDTNKSIIKNNATLLVDSFNKIGNLDL